MMNKTKIEWTERTWNPVTGCTAISPGCRNCYARRMATRLRGRYGYPVDEPFRVTVHEDRMGEPVSWKNPSRIFVCSMGDLFHEDVPDIENATVLSTIRFCAWHTFIILTKRAKRMRKDLPKLVQAITNESVMPNLWVGVTAEDQERADERIPELLATPAAARFVSCEPLLGPVDLRLNDEEEDADGCMEDRRHNLHWVIAGGETGPGARPMHPDWLIGLRDQCQTATVPFFFKSWGEWAPSSAFTGEAVVGFDGGRFPRAGNPPGDLARAVNLGGAWMSQVGRKLAGRRLDGRTHDASPAPRATEPRPC